MIFVLTMLFTFVSDRKNENHWSLLVTHYSEYKHPACCSKMLQQQQTCCSLNVFGHVIQSYSILLH